MVRYGRLAELGKRIAELERRMASVELLTLAVREPDEGDVPEEDERYGDPD